MPRVIYPLFSEARILDNGVNGYEGKLGPGDTRLSSDKRSSTLFALKDLSVLLPLTSTSVPRPSIPGKRKRRSTSNFGQGSIETQGLQAPRKRIRELEKARISNSIPRPPCEEDHFCTIRKRATRPAFKESDNLH